MYLFRLAMASLANRRFTAIVTASVSYTHLTLPTILLV